MLISQVIGELEKLRLKYGDLEVYIAGTEGDIKRYLLNEKDFDVAEEVVNRFDDKRCEGGTVMPIFEKCAKYILIG